MPKSPFLITCVPENAERFAMWLKDRGGISLWKSINLSNPGTSWCTPALSEDGTEYPKPNWQTESTPALTVCDSDFVGVEIPQEFKRIKISLIQRGFKVVLTDGSTRKVNDALDKAGDRAFYTFEDDVAVIWGVRGTVALDEWLAAVSVPTPHVDGGTLAILNALDEREHHGFRSLRFEYERRVGAKTDDDSIRTLMRSLLEQNLVNKDVPQEVPIPRWSLSLRGLTTLRNNRVKESSSDDRS